METLQWVLDRINTRNVILAALAVVLIQLGIFYQNIPRRLYRDWRYPAVKAEPDQAIAAELERKQSKRVEVRYRKISALLEESRAAGYNVDGLSAKAQAALALNRPGYRDVALSTLGELELQIPRKRTQYIPMNETPQEEGAWPGEDLKPSLSSDDHKKSPPKRAKRKRK